MKYKVSELEGALLDAAVALAEGYVAGTAREIATGIVRPTWVTPDTGGWIYQHGFQPSTDWRHGGPIIERERIELISRCSAWAAGFDCDLRAGWFMGANAEGATPLIAAMRAYVASKFGDEVDLPTPEASPARRPLPRAPTAAT